MPLRLASWFVLLDKWMETFVVIARARTVWSPNELATAMIFVNPLWLPPISVWRAWPPRRRGARLLRRGAPLRPHPAPLRQSCGTFPDVGGPFPVLPGSGPEGLALPQPALGTVPLHCGMTLRDRV